jgi:hypothetical protein
MFWLAVFAGVETAGELTAATEEELVGSPRVLRPIAIPPTSNKTAAAAWSQD